MGPTLVEGADRVVVPWRRGATLPVLATGVLIAVWAGSAVQAEAAPAVRECRRECRAVRGTCLADVRRLFRDARSACRLQAGSARRACLGGARAARLAGAAACRQFVGACQACCGSDGVACTARCGDGIVDASRDEACDPPGAVGSCGAGPCDPGCRCPTVPRCEQAPPELSSACDDPGTATDDACGIDPAEISDVVAYLADDAQEGRDNLSAASSRVRQYLIERLQTFAVGGATGGGFEQPFAAGTNVLARIPAADPNVTETVVVGAHYDHLGAPGGLVYNGATDNAAGVAIVLAVGRALAMLPAPLSRPVLLALWDAEEDGLLGSTAYVAAPAVAIADTVAYVNVDIAGASLVRGLRRQTFVVGRDTSAAFPPLLAAAFGGDPLAVGDFGAIFGQGRSDYAPFLAARVPILFFSDTTGGCYHTPGDDAAIVHVGKAVRTAWLVLRVVRALTEGLERPAFRDPLPLVTYADAVTLRAIFERSLCEAAASGLQPDDEAQVRAWIGELDAVLARGPAAFSDVDLAAVGQMAVTAVSILTSLPCQRN